MATYRVQAPDGSTLIIEGPAGAAPEVVIQQAEQLYRARQPNEAQAPEVPGAGMRALIGAGKAFVDSGRGLKQLGLGAVDKIPGVDMSERRERLQGVIDEEKRLSAPVMDSGAGQLGYAGGLLSTALLPGGAVGAGAKAVNSAKGAQLARALTVPNSYKGAAAQGAALGAVPATASDESRTSNMALGAVGGAGGELAGRLLSGGVGMAGALAQPLTESGQERIVGRLIEKFASDPQKLAQALRTNSDELVPGSLPTLAEVASDPGISTLQRAMANNPEMGSVINERLMQNAGARRMALQGLAGDDEALAAAKAARSSVASPLYEAAAETVVQPDEVLGKLMSRPSVQKAMGEANRFMQEAGETIDEGVFTGRQLQYIDQALSDAIGAAGKKEQRLLLKTQSELRGWMENNIPEYMEAQKQFAELSKPINQMQVGQTLYEALAPELTNYGALGKETAATLARAVRNASQTVKKSTGMRKDLKDVLTDDQYHLVENVLRDLSRKANADDLGRGPGSNTGQNLVSQNVIRQALGPLGLPESFTEANAMQRLVTPISKAYGLFGAEQQMQRRLADALVNPQSIQIPMRPNPANPQSLARGLLGQAPALAGSAGALSTQ
nr:hypothetical protein [Flagellatimonas centrodinii]